MSPRPESWHLGSRVKAAAGKKEPLSEFFTARPLCCHWCWRELPLNKLTLSINADVQCLDETDCNKARRKRLHEPDEPAAPTRRVRKPSKKAAPPAPKKSVRRISRRSR